MACSLREVKPILGGFLRGPDDGPHVGLFGRGAVSKTRRLSRLFTSVDTRSFTTQLTRFCLLTAHPLLEQEAVPFARPPVPFYVLLQRSRGARTAISVEGVGWRPSPRSEIRWKLKTKNIWTTSSLGLHSKRGTSPFNFSFLGAGPGTAHNPALGSTKQGRCVWAVVQAGGRSWRDSDLYSLGQPRQLTWKMAI